MHSDLICPRQRFHGLFVRYRESPQGDVMATDLFFVNDTYKDMIPDDSLFLACFGFPPDVSWIRTASRYLSDLPVSPYGRGWFRWDDPILCPDDIPCPLISSRTVDVITFNVQTHTTRTPIHS